MAVSETSAAVLEPAYRGRGRAAPRRPEEYELIWHGLYERALGRCGEPNAARYVASQALTEIEAEDNGRVVGRGDYEFYL
jgi:hypothetical protein